jgi:hypothetical protein
MVTARDSAGCGVAVIRPIPLGASNDRRFQ